jgi:hypothetical protein
MPIMPPIFDPALISEAIAKGISDAIPPLDPERQIYGIHHWISQRCLNEFTFRYNRREAGEGERMNDFLSRVRGRLAYRALIA